MSTLALTRPAPVTARRVASVVRVLLGDAWVLPVWPLGIMGSSFVVNLLVFSLLGDAVEEPVTGGLGSLYIVQMIVCWTLLHQFFGFVVSLGVSRRTYFVAAGLVALAQSVVLGGLVYTLAVIERATGGWGVHLSFFAPLPLVRGAWLPSILVYTVPLVLMSALGFLGGSISKRWASTGILAVTMLSILVLGGVAALITYFDGWVVVGRWLVEQSWVAIAGGWALIPAALAAGTAWLVLRRAVP